MASSTRCPSPSDGVRPLRGTRRFREVVRDFAEQEIGPQAERWDRDHDVPRRGRPRDGASSGCSGCRSRWSTAVRAPTSPRCASPSRRCARVDSSMAITLEAAVGLGAAPIAAYGTEEQRQRWLPDLCAGPHAGRVRPDRTRRRERRRRQPDPRPSGRRRLGDRRRQGVHHELGDADHVAGDGHRAHRRRHVRSPRSSSRPVHRGSSSTRPTGRWGGTRPTPTRSPSPTAGCRSANTLGTEGDGFRQFLATLDDGRIAIAALAVGLAQACLEQSVRYAGRAHRVRCADRREPGRRVPVRRSRGHGRERAAAHLQGGVAEGQRPAVQAGGGDGEALRDRGGRRRDTARDADLRRRRVHRRDTRSAASTATPRSWRSARAPARSSACHRARAAVLPVR